MLAETLDHHDTIGRLIAYGGGGAGLTYTQLAEYAQTTSPADWAQWMFGVAILGRLVFDVVKYIRDGRKK
jgi:hypothetical protein